MKSQRIEHPRHSSDSGGICQVFEIKENEGAKTCPETMENLKPISFMGHGTSEYQTNFPKVFLFAVKYKESGFNEIVPLYADIHTKIGIPAASQLISIRSFTQKCDLIH